MRALRLWVGGCLPLWAVVGWLGTATGAEPPSPAIAPGENLVVQDVPPIPAEIAEKASRYGEYRGAVLNDWHPTKNEMLITTRFGDTNQLFLVKDAGGARQQLTFFPDRVEGGLFDPIRGEYIVFHKGVGGAEFFQNYRYDFATGDITLLTDGKSRNSMVVFSRDGSRSAYTSTRRDGTDTDIYVQFPLDPKTDRLLAECKGGGWQVLDWSPGGKYLLVAEEISIEESYLWLVDASTGEKKAITPRLENGEKVFYGDAKFSSDGKGFVVITDKSSDFRYLGYMLIGGGTVYNLSGDLKQDVTDFDLSKNGERLAFTTNDAGRSELRMFVFSLEEILASNHVDQAHAPAGAVAKLSQATQTNSHGFEANSGLVSSLKWAGDNSTLGFSVGSAHSASDCFTTRHQSVESRRWTFSETGGLPPDSFVDPKLVKWPSFDGKEISGFLYSPDAGKFSGKRPVIVNIHGGPESQYRPGFLGRNNYLVNELGCALIFPNVRGSSGYGKTFVGLDNGFHRDDSYKDIGALLDWIKTQPDLDAERIMVTGGSYGGHMTLAVSTFYADKIRCSVDVVGMSNLKTFLEHTESYRRDLRRVEYGDERDPKMADYLERIAPMNNAAKITKPMFVVQGYNDPRVPRSEAEQIVATLKQQGTPVWFLMAKDEGHGFAKKKNADFQFYATVEFIRRYLLD